MAVLVLNAGSSNLKASVFEVGNTKLVSDEPAWSEKVEWDNTDSESAGKAMVKLLKEIPVQSKIEIVGHRIVHGGDKLTKPTLIDDSVISILQELTELAPLHEPVSIVGIEAARQVYGDVRQLGVFDTSFHDTMPDTAKIYPLPYEWYQKFGIRRFGFHGISHQYASEQAGKLILENLNKTAAKIVCCHLGSGASVCAIEGGASRMTSMGFTPLEGIVMGTRAGSIDPGIILHLIRREHVKPERMDEILNKESGLKGMCGHSSMKDIEKLAEVGDKQCALALQIYVDRLACVIASMLPVLGGLDGLVFTGGVGENSSYVRKAVCEKLAFLGVEIDPKIKTAKDALISTPESKVIVIVIHCREDLAIAKECAKLAAKS